jgi:signal transduction histidine kinase/ActR/RegA family two-component response regulator
MPMPKRMVALLLTLGLVVPLPAQTASPPYTSGPPSPRVTFETQALMTPVPRIRPTIVGNKDVDVAKLEGGAARDQPVSLVSVKQNGTVRAKALLKDLLINGLVDGTFSRSLDLTQRADLMISHNMSYVYHEINNAFTTIELHRSLIALDRGKSEIPLALHQLDFHARKFLAQLKGPADISILVRDKKATSQDLGRQKLEVLSLLRTLPKVLEEMHSLVEQMRDDPSLKDHEFEDISLAVEQFEGRMSVFQGISHPIEVNIHALLERAVKGQVKSNPDLVTHIKFHSSVVKAHIDPTQLDQVFHNLHVNAGHATQHKKDARLDIHTELISEEKLRITFRDNGTGIQAEDLPKIFDPFYTTRKNGEGSGIGLDVASKILKESGGSIRVESVYGEGATFIIELPVLASVRKERENVALIKPTILLVEDEANLGVAMVELLKNHGYGVTWVTRGDDALDEIRTRKYRAMIADSGLPGSVSGETLIQKTHREHPEISILFLSGNPESIRQLKEKQEGVDARVKPINVKDLFQWLDRNTKKDPLPSESLLDVWRAMGAALVLGTGLGISYAILNAGTGLPLVKLGGTDVVMLGSLISSAISGLLSWLFPTAARASQSQFAHNFRSAV